MNDNHELKKNQDENIPVGGLLPIGGSNGGGDGNRNSKILDIHTFSDYHEQKFRKILINDKRTEYEAKILYERIKELSFFNRFFQENHLERLEDDAMIYLCRKMKYQKMPSGTFVFQEGDLSNGLVYMLYSGCVLVINKVESNVYAKLNQEKKLKSENKQTMSSSPPILPQSDIERLRGNTIFINPNSNANTITNPGGINNTQLIWNTTFPQQAKKLHTAVKLIAGMHMRKDKSLSGNANTNDSINEKDTEKNSNEHSIDMDNSIMDIVKQVGFIKDRIYPGEIFGEVALTSDAKRGATILTNTDCEFLVMAAQDFRMVKERFDKTKKIKREFFLKYFPDMINVNSENIIDHYLYNIKEEKYVLDNIIIEEGKSGELVYIIFDGNCEISKTITFEEPNSTEMMSPTIHMKTITICQIGPGAFFGDELLRDTNDMVNNNNGIPNGNIITGKYEYTVRVISSSAKIFSIKRKTFVNRFPPGCIAIVKEIYEQKKYIHQIILKNLIQKQYKGFKLQVYTDTDNINNDNSKSMLNSKIEIQSNRSPKSPSKKNYIPLETCEHIIKTNPIIINIAANKDDITFFKEKIRIPLKIDTNNNNNTTPRAFNTPKIAISPRTAISIQKQTSITPKTATIMTSNTTNQIENSNIIQEDTLYNNNTLEELKILYSKLNKRSYMYDQKDDFNLTCKFSKKTYKIPPYDLIKQKIYGHQKLKTSPIISPANTTCMTSLGNLKGKSKAKECLSNSQNNLNDLTKQRRINSHTNEYDILKEENDLPCIKDNQISLYSSTIIPGHDSVIIEKCQGNIPQFQQENSKESCITRKGNLTERKEGPKINKPICTIRSKVKKTRDWETYFKDLEHNFTSLCEKVKADDIVSPNDINKFKIDFGNNNDNKVMSKKKKFRKIANNINKLNEIKNDYSMLEKVIMKRYDKSKTFYQKKFLDVPKTDIKSRLKLDLPLIEQKKIIQYDAQSTPQTDIVSQHHTDLLSSHRSDIQSSSHKTLKIELPFNTHRIDLQGTPQHQSHIQLSSRTETQLSPHNIDLEQFSPRKKNNNILFHNDSPSHTLYSPTHTLYSQGDRNTTSTRLSFVLNGYAPPSISDKISDNRLNDIKSSSQLTQSTKIIKSRNIDQRILTNPNLPEYCLSLPTPISSTRNINLMNNNPSSYHHHDHDNPNKHISPFNLNQDDTITPHSILKWKHQRYLSLNSKTKSSKKLQSLKFVQHNYIL